MASPEWFVEMLGWKAASKKASPRCVKLFSQAFGPNLADLSSTSSTAIAGLVYATVGVPISKHSDLDLHTAAEGGVQASPGTALERGLESDIVDGLRAIDDDRGWVGIRDAA